MKLLLVKEFHTSPMMSWICSPHNSVRVYKPALQATRERTGLHAAQGTLFCQGLALASQAFSALDSTNPRQSHNLQQTFHFSLASSAFACERAEFKQGKILHHHVCQIQILNIASRQEWWCCCDPKASSWWRLMCSSASPEQNKPLSYEFHSQPLNWSFINMLKKGKGRRPGVFPLFKVLHAWAWDNQAGVTPKWLKSCRA